VTPDLPYQVLLHIPLQWIHPANLSVSDRDGNFRYSSTVSEIAATANRAELTIDELAARVGMTVRNLREWRTLGLLPRAELRGRVGYYAPEVVDRLMRIKQLHAEGFTLELISRMLTAGGDAGDEVMRLAATLRAPFSLEAPAASSPAAGVTRLHQSLERLGLSEEQVLPALSKIKAHTDQIAEIFEQVWMVDVWEPFVASGMPEDELAHIQDTAAHVKPLALETVTAVFAASMESQIERGIARELARATE
jgi:DNA-binding transcriptional MerR regulator